MEPKPAALGSQPNMTPPPSRKRRLARFAIEVVVVLAVFLGLRAWMLRNVVSGSAPPLSGRSLAGEVLSLTAMRGKPVLVHFWATWCSVCKTENGTLERLSKEHPMISVAVDSGKEANVHAWMKAHQVTFPVLVDNGSLSGPWGIHSFPTSFIVDGKGEIRFVETGYTTELGLRARLWLASH